jgi:hypothetical protein
MPQSPEHESETGQGTTVASPHNDPTGRSTFGEPPITVPSGKPRPPSRLLLTLAAVWAAVIAGIWLALHSPFQIEFPLYSADVNARIAGSLGGFLLDCVLLALCTLASWALGDALLTRLWRSYFSAGERFVFAVGLGLGANIMLILGGGVLGGVNPVAAYVLLGIELTLAVWLYGRKLPQARTQFRQSLSNWRTDAANWEKWVAWWLAGCCLLTAFMTFAPPLGWDALMYHLEAPRLYIQAGRIEALPRIGQASFPFGAEMLFLWGMLLRSEGLGQSFSWLYGVLSIPACIIFARRFFGQWGAVRARQAGILAAALYLSAYHVWLLMTWAYTDLMLAFYALLALHAILIAIENTTTGTNTAWLGLLAGIMAGLSCGGKYTAITGAAGAMLGALVYAGLSRPRPGYGKLIQAGVFYTIGGTLSFAPWLIRNILWSGNPVAPLFGGIRGWAELEIRLLAGSDGGVPLTPDVILGRPFQMVLTGNNGNTFNATVSPLWLALAPLGIWAAFRLKVVASAWLAVGITYIGWLAGIRLSAAADHTRILISTFPLLALITAAGLFEFLNLPFKRPTQVLRGVSTGVIGLYLAAAMLVISLFVVANNPLQYHAGLQTRSEWLSAQLSGHYLLASSLNGSTPANSVIFMACEPRAYYFERKTYPDHNFCGQLLYYAERFPTAPELHAALRRDGMTHFLINWRLLDSIESEPKFKLVERARAARQLLKDLETQGFMQLIYSEGGNFAAFQLK